MNANKWLTVVIVTILLGLTCSCSQNAITGKFINRSNLDEYLIINPDGSFTIRTLEGEITGKWESQDNERIYFFSSDQDFRLGARIKEYKIIDDNARVWVEETQFSQGIGTLEYEIIAQWEKVSEVGMVIEFSKDGTLFYANPETGETSPPFANYTFLDNDTIQLSGEDGVVTGDVIIIDDVLILSGVEGIEEYRRVSPEESPRSNDALSILKLWEKEIVSVSFLLAILIFVLLMNRSLTDLLK